MNPILAGMLAELEQKGVTLAIESIQIFAANVLAGKDVVTALNEVAMVMAEKQALLLDSVVAPAKPV